MSTKFKAKALAIAAGCMFTGAVAAAPISFTGSFTHDDDVQFYSVTVGAPTSVTLRTSSYATGGFDPLLALFNSVGMIIGQNNNGTCGQVGADSATGLCLDAYLNITLGAGFYLVGIAQYDNFAIGPSLFDGFQRMGDGDFTATVSCGPQFCDVAGNQREGSWAFDIFFGEQPPGPGEGGGQQTAQVPAPGVLALLGIGLAGLGYSRRKIA